MRGSNPSGAELDGLVRFRRFRPRFTGRAAVGLRIRMRGEAEAVEGCDQLIETFSVHGVDPFRVMDEHSDLEKRAGVGRDHRSVNAQSPRRVRLAAGVDGVVVNQLNPQFAAESLGGGVNIGGSWHCDLQTLEHLSIVPVAAPIQVGDTVSRRLTLYK